ncbi:hypothetical protein [Saccharopolyspora antimicrobica]|nr:hypothetical protein [Saccharopolyspora antimicrobica]
MTRQSQHDPVRRRYAFRRATTLGPGTGSFGTCDQPTITRGESEMGSVLQLVNDETWRVALSPERQPSVGLLDVAGGALMENAGQHEHT